MTDARSRPSAALLTIACATVAAIISASPALAQRQRQPQGAEATPRYLSLEHTGSLGFIAGAFGNYESIEKARCLACHTTEILSGPSASLDVGASLAIGWEGSELTLRLRLTRLGDVPGEAIFLGGRSYFGRDEWKTYVTFELAGHFRPIGAGGARGGFGVAWDFSPIFGLWAEAAASFALGQGRLFGAQFGVGIQARTYLF
ncbi:MAG: hypothetical protein LBM75_10990 [Myxococcales bacterium]|jgi:hypothetical protein|nr:hypothetical protein [Myxococcales bacterium]